MTTPVRELTAFPQVNWKTPLDLARSKPRYLRAPQTQSNLEWSDHRRPMDKIQIPFSRQCEQRYG